jgi:hypothetical protein
VLLVLEEARKYIIRSCQHHRSRTAAVPAEAPGTGFRPR